MKASRSRAASARPASRCGLKESGKPDLALIVSDAPASVAGVFTQNRVVAAPVTLSRSRRARRQRARDRRQLRQRERLHGRAGRAPMRARWPSSPPTQLGCDPVEVLVASTGIIGRPLAMDGCARASPAAAAALSADGGADAVATRSARPTPTRRPARTTVDARRRRRCGSARWRRAPGMIRPDMATMICQVTTDAAIEPAACSACSCPPCSGRSTVISVDGSASTNDSVLRARQRRERRDGDP